MPEKREKRNIARTEIINYMLNHSVTSKAELAKELGLSMPTVLTNVNELIAKGKTKQAMNLVSHGLQYYSERVIDSISPYAKNDAGLIVLVLRHLADEVEKNNPGAKELAAGMEKCVGKPSLQEIERVKKPNRK